MSTIRPELFQAVQELSELPGPTGHEDAVQDWIAERWGRFAKVQRTRVDNVIATVGGSGRKLLVMGHADEICYMVKSVTENGFIHLWPYYGDSSGFPPKWMLPLNQPALVLTGIRHGAGLLCHDERTRHVEKGPRSGSLGME